jgi:hypothetical protein
MLKVGREIPEKGFSDVCNSLLRGCGDFFVNR